MESSTPHPLPPPPPATEESDDANGSGRRISRGFSELFSEILPDSSSSPLSSEGPAGTTDDPADSPSSMERWEATRSSDDETENNFRQRNEELRETHGSGDRSRVGRRRRRYSEHAPSSSSSSSDDSASDRRQYRSHRFKSERGRVTSGGSAGLTINANSSLSRERREGSTRFSMIERERNFRRMERVNRRLDKVVEGAKPLRRDVFSTTEPKRQFRVEFGHGDRSRVGRRRRRLSEYATTLSSSSSDDSDRSRHSRVTSGGSVGPLDGSIDGGKTNEKSRLSREQKEVIRFLMVDCQRKKDFRHMEMIKGRMVNILEGLELHRDIFSAAEQKRIVDSVYDFQEKGRNRQLRERTYSEPRKWMRGKGRVTIQFGCCYNYATDKNGNPPGIIRDEEVDPIPPILKRMIKRMVAWHVLPPTCIPNSCIVNIYEKDDCIPPHIDHHDFVRPFCTVSFLAECNILFGTELKILGPGEFSGSTAIPLPKGSVLILKGNGADVAKHCVPAVPAKRISITFRKMDDSKLPFKFVPDPELNNLTPLQYPPVPIQTLIWSEEQKNEAEAIGEKPVKGRDDSFPQVRSWSM